MSYPNLSEYNVIVLNFETTTFIPFMTITRANNKTLDTSYPSIIVNIYNETNLFIINSTRSLLSTLASYTSGTSIISSPFATITPPPLSSIVEFSSTLTNLTTTKTAVTTTTSSKNDTSFQNSVIVPLYAVIFLLSVVGNFLVILTLAQNKRMRTVTNVYLLNLAVSDLLLGVFCMPFTLVGQMLRNFIFGRLMCKLIPYFQAVSVSVAVWTLVAISLERYFAICRPLTSRRWQTQFHAYKMILLVWIISFACNSPLLIVQQLQPMTRSGGGEGANKCREVWPSRSSERTYVIFLDIALLLLPLLAMGLAYSLIVSKLWRGLKREMKHTSTCSSTKELRRSPSLNTVNGVLINNDQIQNTNLSSPSRQNKNNRVLLPPQHLNSTSGNSSYVNLLQKKFKNSSKKSKSKLTILNNSNPNSNCKKPNLKSGQNTEAVKLWLFKSIVHVKPQKSNGNGNHSNTGTTNTNTNGQTNLRLNSVNKTMNFPNNHESIISEIELNSNADGGGTNNSGGNGNNNGNGGIDIKEDKNGIPDITTYTFCRHAIRSTYMDKSIEAKKKVIRMLFVIIVEFFVCWAPIHILNTVYLFSPAFVYHHVSSTGIALVQLMAYISSCCNPITYCFMNRRFRQAFMAIFNCYKCRRCCSKTPETGEGHNSIGRHELIAGIPCNSDASGNDSIVYLGRTNGLNRSEILVLEAEDRV